MVWEKPLAAQGRDGGSEMRAAAALLPGAARSGCQGIDMCQTMGTG